MEGNGITSHSASLGERSCTPIRLIVQSGSSSERCFLDMLHTDYIADLRAEIVKWCEGLQQVFHSGLMHCLSNYIKTIFSAEKRRN